MREVFYDPAHVTEALVDEILDFVSDRRRAISLVRIATVAKRNNLREELHRVKCPTLLVWGENDQITPPSVAQEFQKLMPHSDLEFIAECGHAPTREQPEKFNAIVEAFLQRHFGANHG